MSVRLVDKPELLADIIPEFSPHCRRLTPGPGYLEALTKDNVSFIRNPIKRITETGIETEDGVHREVDAIICSTGAKVDFAPNFPIISGTLDLSEAWTPGGHWGFPYTYMGLATPGFPNLAFLHGTLTSLNPFNCLEIVPLTDTAQYLRSQRLGLVRDNPPQ